MANNAVTAKARAIYGKMLTKDDMNVLTHKGTVPAAVAYLKSKPLYAGTFADTEEATVRREHAEALINRSVYDNYLRVLRYASGDKDGIMSFYIRRLECDQLIKAVIAISGGEQEGFIASFPEYAADKLGFDALKLAGVKELPAVAPLIKGTIYYRALLPLLTAAEPDIDRILTTISVCYIKWAFEQINRSERGKTRELLKDFFLRKTDADNLLMCMRLKSLGIANERIKELMIPYHKRLRRCEIDTALGLPNAVQVLREMFIGERLIAEEVSEIPEINVNIADRRFFRHRLAVCTNETEALYSLTMLMTAESTDLCRIIECLRYGLAPEETEKYLAI
jgi:V/A-type H+-transporting ATPase subunit C